MDGRGRGNAILNGTPSQTRKHQFTIYYGKVSNITHGQRYCSGPPSLARQSYRGHIFKNRHVNHHVKLHVNPHVKRHVNCHVDCHINRVRIVVFPEKLGDPRVRHAP